MAKDRTNRGGPRPGLGRPRKPLIERINEGTAKGAPVMPEEISQTADLLGDDIPKVRDYMKVRQKDGSYLCAEDVFNDTFRCLREHRCERFVSKQLIEQYAMSVARWIQCEMAISEFGYLAKHPTTGNAIASPFVSMSREYKKQTNADWYQIYQIVRDNCTVDYSGYSPQDDAMERLLRMRSNQKQKKL